MAKIQDFPVFNFDGGVKRNKSLLELKRNELRDARNVEINEDGRIRVRRGSHQLGNTPAVSNIENSYYFIRQVAGSTPTAIFIMSDNSSPASFYRLIGTRTTSAITTASTTIGVSSTTAFPASGTIEIEGDLIAYTGVSGGNTFTGVTGIGFSHPTGSAVHQWAGLTTASSINGSTGVYYTTINNVLIINGTGGIWDQIDNNDGTTVTAVSAEPSGIFITAYRNRAYVAGDNASGGTNSSPRRVSFSNLGTALTWTTASDFFDVDDQTGEYITGFRVLNDRLWIFKPNSMWSYDEIELKQRQSSVGAWNHKVVQEINGLFYTFSSEGIFETNGFSSRNIGEPVRQFWKNFRPIFDTNNRRVVINTFASQFDKKYILYIYDITDPETTADVVLEYDIIKRNWKVYTGSFTNFFHLNYMPRFRYGNQLQDTPALFGGNDGGQLFRFYESRSLDASNVLRGGDVLQDLLSNTGTPVSAYIETPLYDLTHPDLWKIFQDIKFSVEQGDWLVEYRVETEKGITEYRRLGVVRNITTLSFPKEAQGYRVGFRISTTSRDHVPILNGFTIMNTITTGRK